jgi:hypothetical protein
MGFVERRVHRNVRVSDLLRRTVAVVPRVLPGALLPLGLAWLPALAGALLAPSPTRQDDTWAYVVPAALSAWSIVLAPLLAAFLVAPVVRAQAGSRLKAASVAVGGFPRLGKALLPGLLAGLATMAGHALCVLPGYFVGALWFVVGPVAAVEGGGLAAFARARTLTRDNRLMLAGVAFLIMFLEGVLFRFAQFFERIGDYSAYFVVGSVVTTFTLLLRASASAVAYEQLRVEKDGLELGQLAEQLGGVDTGLDDLALSERSVEAMAKRRAVVGKLVGQSDALDDAEAMASVRDMEAVAQRQRRRMRITVGVVASVVVTGTVVALGIGAYNRVQENRALDAMVQGVREAEVAIAEPPPSTEPTDGFRQRAHRADALSLQIAANLQRAPAGRRRELLGRMMALHSDTFYGDGFTKSFDLLGSGANDVELVSSLRVAAEAAGCGPALDDAKRDEKNPARAFAKACPKGETAPLDYQRFRPGIPLGRAALAELLEMRARERGIESQTLHDVIEQLLLPQR